MGPRTTRPRRAGDGLAQDGAASLRPKVPGGLPDMLTDLGARRAVSPSTRRALLIACASAACLSFVHSLIVGPPDLSGANSGLGISYLIGSALGQVLFSALVIGGAVQLTSYITVVRKTAPQRWASHTLAVMAAAALGAAPLSLAPLAVGGGINAQQVRTLDSDYSLAVYDAHFEADSRLIELLSWGDFFGTHLRRPSDLPELRTRVAQAREVIATREQRVRQVQTDTFAQIDGLGGIPRRPRLHPCKFPAWI